ncbi:MAG: ribosomal protein S18-alanine N-acetyltransferase [Clostridia bacterium]|nr:ribosomal protein S18-alanine N-acetyltransferase [Clostridia bacterium]
MTVSKLTSKEIAAVAALDKELFSKESWSEADFEASLTDPSRFFWVATEGETLLGFCGLSQSFEQGDILNIGVCPDARGKGIGSQLLRQAIKTFQEQGGKELFLEVRASNAAAKALYEKFGFRQIGIRKGYYQQPAEDGLVYRLG